MKATGIVRRIDDLGRIVIPKEIRRTMRIREGDPLEIYTDREGEVIFKKYSPIGELTAFAAQYAEALHKACDLAVVICDRDAVIACAGLPKRDFTDKPLSPELEELISARSLYVAAGEKAAKVTAEGEEAFTVAYMMPIITEGDIAGCVATLRPAAEASVDLSRESTEAKLVATAAAFLGRQLES